MTEYVQPILIALAVLLIPACVKLGVNAIKKKLDEGRVLAQATAADLKKVTNQHAENVAKLLNEHRSELMADVQEIKALATATNGKVAAHDKQLTIHETKIDMLVSLATKGIPE